MSSKDTIFAVATPPGRSAIAVIRISGLQAAQAPGLFKAACPKPGQFILARLFSTDQIIDESLILFMKAPKSSTGEDVCEFHCHGSFAVVNIVLEKFANTVGFRLADPGEFTRRAFMNNKLDLLGVEGLADIIDAETPIQLHQAWAQIDGCLGGPVNQWREDLISLGSRLEALIDFVDEELPDGIETKLRQETASLIKSIAITLNDQRTGELVRDGVVIALIGPINAGKSTILNGLAGRAAAIVSEQAGTTRDIISIRVDINGVPTTILDTAGIRDTVEIIEAEGIRRAFEAAKYADVVIHVFDAASANWSHDAARMLKKLGQPDLFVLNKVDKGVQGTAPNEAMLLSAQDDYDISKLLTRLGEVIMPYNQAQNSAIITRVRHRQALQQAHDSLCAGLQQDFHLAPELAAEDFRQAAAALGRITGDVDVEELLGKIFSTFCIGK